jgi:hypothetical protein
MLCNQCNVNPAKWKEETSSLVFCSAPCQLQFIAGTKRERDDKEEPEPDSKSTMRNVITTLKTLKEYEIYLPRTTQLLLAYDLAKGITQKTKAEIVNAIQDYAHPMDVMYKAITEGDNIVAMALYDIKDLDTNQVLDLVCLAYPNPPLLRLLLTRGDLQLGANPNFRKSRSLLARVAGFDGGDRLKIIDILLADDRVSITEQSGDGTTPMHHAVENALHLKRLLEIPNAPVNARNAVGETPLFYAAHHDMIESVRLLLQHPNIDPNAQNRDGNNALMQYLHSPGHSLKQTTEMVFVFTHHRNFDWLSVNRQGHGIFNFVRNSPLVELILRAVIEVTTSVGPVPKDLQRHINKQRLRDHLCRDVFGPVPLHTLRSFADLVGIVYLPTDNQDAICTKLSQFFARREWMK